MSSYDWRSQLESELGRVDECWKTHKKVGMKMKGGKLVPNCVPKNEDAEARLKTRIKARQVANDKKDRIALAKAKVRDTVNDIRGEDVSEISTQKINRYYDKAKQSHDRAGNSAFARSHRKEPGIEKDLDTIQQHIGKDFE